MSTANITFLCVTIGLGILGIVIKNILLRIVMKKKEEILEVFFEIPRKSCTSIQKECERFIQRLSSENQEDFETVSITSEDSESGFQGEKKGHRQKKRTIVGE
jgi:hypothetical protein